ncbi:MAG TPA: two-component sensor histidine kinase, partial [Geobacteraceae bacterium]|nr:two-component sensor histidine kinase [Geobacteraceae bacterium]
MNSRHRLSLTSAILASLASLLLLTWLLLSIISFKTAEKDLLSLKITHARTLLTAVLATLPDDFAATGKLGTQLRRTADALALEKDFAGLIMLSAEGTVVFSHGDKLGNDSRLTATRITGAEASIITDNGQMLLTYFPIRSASAPAGAVR